jgi:(S)-2-hydroxyglutarate dehydrogenase
MLVNSYDLIILGAGITGLSVARQKLLDEPNCRVLVIEKEPKIGMHGSGRNSGVLHSGIYYPSDTLKAKFCSEGSELMASYCEKYNLPLMKCGKVILPTKSEDEDQIDLLYKRGVKNGASVKIISQKELREIEPEASTIAQRALYSPNTSVIDPYAVLSKIQSELNNSDVTILFNEKVISANPDQSTITTNKDNNFKYKHLINCTGQYSDVVSKLFNVGKKYTLLPFKGLYYGLSKNSNIRLNGLIYPVPDLSIPFLGIHSVKLVNGSVYFGPTAIPAFGRENYQGFEGVNIKDASSISYHLLRQYISNKKGFRAYTHQEASRFLKSEFLKSMQSLVPNLSSNDLVISHKVGIRAQLLDTKRNELVMDFVVERVDNTTHVLNAVSPAFTSAFSFAKYILNK